MSLKELSPDERKCVEAYLKELRSRTGSSWCVGPKLDRRFRSISTPECRLKSGSRRVAVEVKRLFDTESGPVFGNTHAMARRLNPQVKGHVVVILPRAYQGKRLRVDIERNLEAEVERVVPTLEYGQRGYIRVYHQSRLTLDGAASGYGLVYCSHARHPGLPWRFDEADGLFRLHDSDTAGETYTNKAIDDLHRALLLGCEELAVSGKRLVSVDWYEEWNVLRAHGSGVSVQAVVGGWAESEVILKPLEKVVREGNAKFQQRAWAPLRVLLIYDRFLGGGFVKDVRTAFEKVSPNTYADLDEIWLVSNGELSSLYIRA